MRFISFQIITEATSPSEWWSSCLHELRHSAQAIIDYYGADWNEDDAYLTGFLTKRAVEIGRALFLTNLSAFLLLGGQLSRKSKERP